MARICLEPESFVGNTQNAIQESSFFRVAIFEVRLAMIANLKLEAHMLFVPFKGVELTEGEEIIPMQYDRNNVGWMPEASGARNAADTSKFGK